MDGGLASAVLVASGSSFMASRMGRIVAEANGILVLGKGVTCCSKLVKTAAKHGHAQMEQQLS